MAPAENQTKPERETTKGSLKPDQTDPGTASTTVQNREPEDAYLTGGQRNLQRRVLGLNVEEKKIPPQSPGLHSTGSFTGVANGASVANDKDQPPSTARGEK